MPRSRRDRLVFALLPALALLLYYPVLRGGFLWDDDKSVAQNLALRAWGGLRDFWIKPGAAPTYYPLTYSAFWLEYHLWGLNTTGYHLVNILLHGLNGALVALVLRRLRIRGAWLAGALFVVHPVQVESVAWIIELKNVLSGTFYLSAALAYLDFEERGRKAAYGAALGLYLCALLCKSVTCSLPAALLLAVWARGRSPSRELPRLAPFFGLGLALAYVTVRFEGRWIGAQGPEWSLTFAQRLLIAARALCFYAGKLAWPAPLSFVYPRWVVDPADVRQWAWLPLAALVFALLYVELRRWGRWPLAAGLYFAGTLLPALGFFDIYCMRFSFVADHFQYLACLGPLALAAATLRRYRLPAAVVVVLLGATARLAEAKYRNIAELWLDTVEKDPGSALGHHGLGVLLGQRGLWSQAEGELATAARLNPRFEETQLALAYVLLQEGRRTEALERFRSAQALGLPDPSIAAEFDRLAHGRDGPPRAR